jgi:hypothetical protein
VKGGMDTLNKGLQLILANASEFEYFKSKKYPLLTERTFQEKVIQDVREILAAGVLDQEAQGRVQQWLTEIQQG